MASLIRISLSLFPLSSRSVANMMRDPTKSMMDHAWGQILKAEPYPGIQFLASTNPTHSDATPPYRLSVILLPGPQLLSHVASRRILHPRCEAGSFCPPVSRQPQSRGLSFQLVTESLRSLSLLLSCWPMDIFLAAWNMAYVPVVLPCLSSDRAYLSSSFFAVSICCHVFPQSLVALHKILAQKLDSISTLIPSQKLPSHSPWKPQPALLTETLGCHLGSASPGSATFSDLTARQPYSAMGEGPSQNSGTFATDASFGCLQKETSARYKILN